MLLKPLADPKSAAARASPLPFPESHFMTREEHLQAAFRSRLDRLTSEIKSRLTVKFGSKQKEIRITFQPCELLKLRCDETVSTNTLGTYLTNSFYDLLIKAESNSIEEAYFVLKKVQALVGFLKANSDKAAFEGEAICSRTNELVFLQNNDLTEAFVTRFGEFVRFLQTSGPKMRKVGPTTPPDEAKKVFMSKMLAVKAKTKALFAVALMFSDQKRHDVAITHALKALKCGYTAVQITLTIVFFKLLRKTEKMRAAADDARRLKATQQVQHLENLARVLTTILDRLDSAPHVIKKSAKVSATLAALRTAYLEKSEAFACYSPEELDLSFLSSPQAIASSVLKDATILHLTHMTYTGYGQELDTRLSDELTEQSLYEKIANLAVAFYILSVEHRFTEHNHLSGSKFYKSLLDYYNPGCAAKGSEFFLSKAVELAYLYLPDCFPFVSQILLVFKNFELNRSKVIPENGEDAETALYLHPFKNGFKSSLIIPIIRSPIQWLPLGRSDPPRDRDRAAKVEAEFLSEKSIWKNFEKDPKSLIQKIYVPKQKVAGFKTEKPKLASAVMRSPDLIAQKQLNAIKLKVFRGGSGNASAVFPGSRDEIGSGLLDASLTMSGAIPSANSLGASTKVSQTKYKSTGPVAQKPRIGSSKAPSNKENEAPSRSEKRANSSEITRTAKDMKVEKKSAQGRLPAKANPKSEFSLLKSTEFLFAENIRKVALKLRSNNENVDLNKNGPLVGHMRPNGPDKRQQRSEGVAGEGISRDTGSGFFAQLGSQKSSPVKPTTDFKISGAMKPPATVFFQNFVKNKQSIAEILSKFK